jgi:hypothetical protein
MAGMSSSEWLTPESRSSAKVAASSKHHSSQISHADEAIDPRNRNRSESGSSAGTIVSAAEDVQLRSPILTASNTQDNWPNQNIQPPGPPQPTDAPRDHREVASNHPAIAEDMSNTTWFFRISHQQWDMAWHKSRLQPTYTTNVVRLTRATDPAMTTYLRCYDEPDITTDIDIPRQLGSRIFVLPWQAYCHRCNILRDLKHFDAFQAGLVVILAKWSLTEDTYDPPHDYKWKCRDCVAVEFLRSQVPIGRVIEI